MPVADLAALRSLTETLRSCGVAEVSLDDEGRVTRVVMRPDAPSEMPGLVATARSHDEPDAPGDPVRPGDPLWQSTGSRVERAPHPRSMATDVPPDDEGDDE